MWLRDTCPCFTPEYLDYLSNYRFKPEQVSIQFIPTSDCGELGKAHIDMKGLWIEAILWEVPLMACISEIYYSTVVTDWNYDGQDGQIDLP
jgi:nicotinate phosphoribosyltransferase